jgi:hypothetical protein
MRFRGRYSVQGTFVQRGDRLAIAVPGFAVTLLKGPHPNDATVEAIAVEALCEREPPADVERYLLAYASGTGGDAPSEVLDFARELMGEQNAACRRCVELLRWRMRSDSPHSPYAGLGSEFTLDGTTWHGLPSRGHMYGFRRNGLILTGSASDAVQQLVGVGAYEPIAHQLLREARDISMANPRSAVMIAVAGVEAGFKGLVASLVPGAAWLVEKVPSPPIEKMLKEYLPLLPVRTIDGCADAPPKYARTLLHNAVEERNRISHLGRGSIDHQALLDTLDAIQDTLYLFDFYEGHDWAWNEMSDQYRAGLGS